jgi:hypothetical protein
MPWEDFELIIVDHFYRERRQGVELLKYADEFPAIKHVSPNLPDCVYANSTGWNMGLRLAEGELVTFIVDFCWLPQDFLERHWSFYKAHPGYSLSVYVDRYKYPPLADMTYPVENMFSIFETKFDVAFAEKFFVAENLIYAERKGGALGEKINETCYEMPGDKIYMLGDSVPLEVMKSLNGWDGAFNGGYGSNDVDIGVRAAMLGWKFAVDHSAPTLKKLGDKSMAHLLPTAKTEYTKTPEQNYAIYQERIKAIQEGREPLAVPEGRGAWW